MVELYGNFKEIVKFSQTVAGCFEKRKKFLEKLAGNFRKITQKFLRNLMNKKIKKLWNISKIFYENFKEIVIKYLRAFF